MKNLLKISLLLFISFNSAATVVCSKMTINKLTIREDKVYFSGSNTNTNQLNLHFAGLKSAFPTAFSLLHSAKLLGEKVDVEYPAGYDCSNPDTEIAAVSITLGDEPSEIDLFVGEPHEVRYRDRETFGYFTGETQVLFMIQQQDFDACQAWVVKYRDLTGNRLILTESGQVTQLSNYDTHPVNWLSKPGDDQFLYFPVTVNETPRDTDYLVDLEFRCQ